MITDALTMETADAAQSMPGLPLSELMINISIVEDDAKLRDTMARYLSAQPGMRCASKYPNAEAALADLPRVQPHVVLMDINLPGMSGIECVARLHREVP